MAELQLPLHSSMELRWLAVLAVEVILCNYSLDVLDGDRLLNHAIFER
jgi:hypothetical protein